MYYNTVTLGEKKLGLVAIRHEEEAGQTKPAMDPRPIHFVHVLDRSGSMAPHIHELIDHVQRTLALLSERDRVSVIWFSGPGQYRTLIKGARKDDDLTALLNSLRSALYTTCFSEPLAEVNQLIAELGSLAPIAVTLFTDGLPVVAWGEAEEERRALAEVRKMAGAVLAVNTVGYGPNYNQDFLRRLAGASEMGRMTHSSRIGDYYTIFERNAMTAAASTPEPISIIVPPGVRVLYATPTLAKLVEGNLDLANADKDRNWFVLLGGGEFKFQYQGITYTSANGPAVIGQPLSSKLLEDFLYA